MDNKYENSILFINNYLDEKGNEHDETDIIRSLSALARCKGTLDIQPGKVVVIDVPCGPSVQNQDNLERVRSVNQLLATKEIEAVIFKDISIPSADFINIFQSLRYPTYYVTPCLKVFKMEA